MNLSHILASLFIVLASIACPGQDAAQYTIDAYDTDDGLPQSGIKQIMTDRFGYCWIATEEGFLRFDGRSFRHFGVLDIPGLRNDRISFMNVDINGDVFASSANDQVITISQLNQLAPLTPGIVEKEEMIIPVAGYACRVNYSLDSVFHTLQIKNRRDIVINACTRNGDIYLSYNKKLFFIEKSGRTMQIAEKPLEDRYNFSIAENNVYFRLFPHHKVKAWLNGLPLPHVDHLAGDIVRDGVRLIPGNFNITWSQHGPYLYAGRNIYRVTLENDTLKTYKVIENIRIDRLSAICFLPQENRYLIYSSTEYPKIFVVQMSGFRMQKLLKKDINQGVYAHSAFSKSEVFVKNHLLSINGPQKDLPAKTDQSNDNRAQYVSPEQEIYFERNFNLVRYNSRTGKTDSLVRLDATMHAIFPSLDGDTLIFCTELSVNRLVSGKLVSSRTPAIRHKMTTCFQLDHNRFLLGTESGLKWFDFAKNTIEKSILDSASIWSLYLDNDQRIWISTYGKGFFLYENGWLFSFPTGPDGSLRTVHTFITDRRDNFWMPTNNGLFVVPKTELLAYARGLVSDVYYFIYKTSDGLSTNEFNGGSMPSHVWLANGMLSLPSQQGLVWFYPETIGQNFSTSALFLEKFLLNAKPTQPDTLRQLPPGNHQLEFRIGSPYFGNPENLFIEYFLEGYSNTWLPLPTNGKVTFQNLPSHQYRLRFRKRTNSDYSHYSELNFPIVIAPFFYNTWWFYTLCGLLLLLASYLFTRWRVRNLKKETLLLEEKVSERTETLNQTIVQLKESQLRLKESNDIKDRIVSMVLHDLRSPIRFLEMMGARLLQNHEKLDKDTLAKRINEIRNSASSIYSYANQFLTWTSAQHGFYAVRFQWVKLMPMLTEIHVLYAEIAGYQYNKLIIYPTDARCYTDANLLTAILRNLVDNAMKHTNRGKISLSVEKRQGEIYIIVADTGVGMTQAQIDAFYGRQDEAGSAGLGSALIRDLLQKIDGRLLIASQPGNGSTFSVILSENPVPAHEDEPTL